jgi:hypothetical protein
MFWDIRYKLPCHRSTCTPLYYFVVLVHSVNSALGIGYGEVGAGHTHTESTRRRMTKRGLMVGFYPLLPVRTFPFFYVGCLVPNHPFCRPPWLTARGTGRSRNGWSRSSCMRDNRSRRGRVATLKRRHYIRFDMYRSALRQTPGDAGQSI